MLYYEKLLFIGKYCLNKHDYMIEHYGIYATNIERESL